MEIPCAMRDSNATHENEPVSQKIVPENPQPQLWRGLFEVLKNLVLGLLTVLVLCLLFEGASSVVLAVRDFTTAPIMAESRHTRYDSELGWSNIPNVYIPDMYGPSEYLKINSQGYRNGRDFSQKVPPGKVRVVCSGDSFTFGYGVNNDETWCQLLETHDRRLETVNMGQGAYGADQTYLWYKRDVDRLSLDVHLIAAIGNDFDRMLSNTFAGYNKPTLRMDGGRLVAGNTPVPKGVWKARLVAASQRLEEVRSYTLLSRLIRKFHPGEADTAFVTQIRPVISGMLDSVRDLDRSRNRIAVLVYLPTFRECYLAETEDWRQLVAAEASARGIFVIDLLPDFLALPVRQAGDMFIQQVSTKYAGGRGHYSIAGNRFVADRVYSRLLSIPEIKRRIDGFHQ